MQHAAINSLPPHVQSCALPDSFPLRGNKRCTSENPRIESVRMFLRFISAPRQGLVALGLPYFRFAAINAAPRQNPPSELGVLRSACGLFFQIIIPDTENLGGEFSGPAAFGIHPGLDLYEIDIGKAGRLAVERNGI